MKNKKRKATQKKKKKKKCTQLKNKINREKN